MLDQTIAQDYIKAKSLLRSHIESLGLEGRDAIIQQGKFKGRKCRINNVIHHQNWKSDQLELQITVEVYKLNGPGFLNTYHDAYLRTYRPLSFVELV